MKSDTKEMIIEWLMTYGWAILVIVIALGSLLYFGVLHPDNLLPKCEDECSEPVYNNDSTKYLIHCMRMEKVDGNCVPMGNVGD